MDVRPALALALALAFALPGCASPALATCPPLGSSPGASPFCVVADGWPLQGVQWNANDSKAKTVILVHGLNEDHHSYDVLAQELAARGWRVLGFDSRGMGLSNNSGSFQDFTPDQFSAMDRDLDAVAALVGGHPRALVGASVGASEALRFAARADKEAALYLLSPGWSYQSIAVGPSDAAHSGPVFFLASHDDAYAVQSIEALVSSHGGPSEKRILDGARHGTQALELADVRSSIVDWLDARANASVTR